MKLSPSDLKSAAGSGDIDAVNQCIAAKVHLQPGTSSALFDAITGGHVSCVQAMVSAGTTVENKHYYAAGSVDAFNASSIFMILKGQQYTRPKYPAEHCFANEDLKELCAKLRSGSLSENDRFDYLLSAISQANIPAMRLLLEHNTPVAPDHFYTAGKHFSNNPSSSQETCKRMFTLLEAFAGKTQLNERFYQPEETAIYQDAVTNQPSTTTITLAPSAYYTTRKF